MLNQLCIGIRGVNDPAAFDQFLFDVWAQQHNGSLRQWMLRAVGQAFDVETLPQFRHGGAATGKILVVGINPGSKEPLRSVENQYLDASPDHYLAFHNRFFEKFPVLARTARSHSPFWDKAPRIIEGIFGASRLAGESPGLPQPYLCGPRPDPDALSRMDLVR